MGNEAAKLRSGIDLAKAAKNEYYFLRMVDNFPGLFNAHTLHYAIFRYETYWLPFACKQPETAVLAAPLDIAWVWHVHMLAPHAYERDCLNILGKVIDHRPLAPVERIKVLDEIKGLWSNMYPGVPFDIDLNSIAPEVAQDFDPKITYDLTSACLRQRVFNYQVSLPHFRDDKFLKKALKRYYVMLKIKQESPSTFVVPCYDNDMIWHTHQLHPLAYKLDTVALLGKMLDHDDSVNDRAPGKKLDVSSQETRWLWEKENKSFSVSGGMFRGEPPIQVAEGHPSRFQSLANPIISVQLQQIQLQNLRDGNYKIVITTDTKFGANNVTEILSEKFKATDGTWIKAIDVIIDTEVQLAIMIKVTKQLKTPFADPPVYTLSLPLPPAGELDPKDNYIIPLQIQAEKLGEPSLTGALHILCQNIKFGNYVFASVSTDREFTYGQHITKILHYPGLMAPFAEFEVAATCQHRSNIILNNLEVPSFTWNVIHCQHPNLSVVEILDSYGQVTATGHTVGSSVLPESEQVSDTKRCCTLNPIIERAMLIRGVNRDWGILKASWKGFVKGSISVRGAPGQLELSLFRLLPPQGLVPISSQSSSSFTAFVDGTTISVDLNSGMINFTPEITIIPEAICLACCIAVMFVLCQPRPPPKKNKTTGQLEPYTEPRKKPGSITLDGMTFLRGAGLYAALLPRSYHVLTSGGYFCQTDPVRYHSAGGGIWAGWYDYGVDGWAGDEGGCGEYGGGNGGWVGGWDGGWDGGCFDAGGDGGGCGGGGCGGGGCGGGGCGGG